MLPRLPNPFQLIPKGTADVMVGAERRMACAGASGIWLAELAV
jgi:hypothetical protein